MCLFDVLEHREHRHDVEGRVAERKGRKAFRVERDQLQWWNEAYPRLWMDLIDAEAFGEVRSVEEGGEASAPDVED